jgi:hypothetical protein
MMRPGLDQDFGASFLSNLQNQMMSIDEDKISQRHRAMIYFVVVEIRS